MRESFIARVGQLVSYLGLKLEFSMITYGVIVSVTWPNSVLTNVIM